MTFPGNIVYLHHCSVICVPRCARAENDTTRAQINNIPSKSHVIPSLLASGGILPGVPQGTAIQHSDSTIQNNMADEQEQQASLSPEDISGARVSEEQIGKLTVSQLKFWLKCRRINQSGNKKELLERYVCHPSNVSSL